MGRPAREIEWQTAELRDFARVQKCRSCMWPDRPSGPTYGLGDDFRSPRRRPRTGRPVRDLGEVNAETVHAEGQRVEVDTGLLVLLFSRCRRTQPTCRAGSGRGRGALGAIGFELAMS